MATNVTVQAIDGPAVIYLQDGSAVSIEAQQEKFIQLPEGHMLTISDTPPKQEPVEGAEHPPPGYAFAKAMVEFWTAMLEKAKAEAPAATPVIATVTPQ